MHPPNALWAGASQEACINTKVERTIRFQGDNVPLRFKGFYLVLINIIIIIVFIGILTSLLLVPIL